MPPETERLSESPYRHVDQEPDPYLEAWARLRRLERRGWWFLAPLTVGFVVWLATAFALSLRHGDPVARQGIRISTMLVAAYTVVLAVATAPIAVFRSVCPRCGYSKLVWAVPGSAYGPFERRRGSRQATCRRCGIVVGTPKSAYDPATGELLQPVAKRAQGENDRASPPDRPST